MAIWVKLSGIIENIAENDLVKEFLEKFKNKNYNIWAALYFWLPLMQWQYKTGQLRRIIVRKVRLWIHRGTAVIYLIEEDAHFFYSGYNKVKLIFAICGVVWTVWSTNAKAQSVRLCC